MMERTTESARKKSKRNNKKNAEKTTERNWKYGLDKLSSVSA